MAKTWFRDENGIDLVITNNIVDENGLPQLADTVFLDENGDSIPIWYGDSGRLPSSLLPGSNRMFKTYSPRIFKAGTFKRIFKA